MIRIALDRSWPDVIHALRGDSAFRTSLAERLRAVPYEAWFWECIRVSDGPFECVAIDAPALARQTADPSAFAEHRTVADRLVSAPGGVPAQRTCRSDRRIPLRDRRGDRQLVRAERPLLHFHQALKKLPTRTPEEQEFLDNMLKTWEETRAEGRAEGNVETAAQAVLAVLRVRDIAVPAAARKRILAQKDLKQLQRWHEKAVVVTSIDDLFKSRS